MRRHPPPFKLSQRRSDPAQADLGVSGTGLGAGPSVPRTCPLPARARLFICFVSCRRLVRLVFRSWDYPCAFGFLDFRSPATSRSSISLRRRWARRVRPIAVCTHGLLPRSGLPGSLLRWSFRGRGHCCSIRTPEFIGRHRWTRLGLPPFLSARPRSWRRHGRDHDFRVFRDFCLKKGEKGKVC